MSLPVVILALIGLVFVFVAFYAWAYGYRQVRAVTTILFAGLSLVAAFMASLLHQTAAADANQLTALSDLELIRVLAPAALIICGVEAIVGWCIFALIQFLSEMEKQI